MLNALNKAGVIQKLIMYVNCCFVFPQFIFEMTYIIKAPDGYLNAVKCLGAASFRILSIARLLHYIIWNDKYIEIWHSLKRNSFNFDHFYFDVLNNAKIKSILMRYDCKNNYKNLKLFWQTMELINVQNFDKQTKITNVCKETVKKYKGLSYGAFAFMMSGTTLSLLLSFLLVLIKPPTLIYEVDLQRDVVLNELPYRILIPYVDLKDPFQYKLAMWYEAYAISYLSYSFLSNVIFIEFRIRN